MRKIRNPRFAPEFLERKLSPSSAGYAMIGAQVRTYDGPTYPPTDPTNPLDPTAPTTPPGDPSGPIGPGVFYAS